MEIVHFPSQNRSVWAYTSISRVPAFCDIIFAVLILSNVQMVIQIIWTIWGISEHLWIVEYFIFDIVLEDATQSKSQSLVVTDDYCFHRDIDANIRTTKEAPHIYAHINELIQRVVQHKTYMWAVICPQKKTFERERKQNLNESSQSGHISDGRKPFLLYDRIGVETIRIVCSYVCGCMNVHERAASLRE